MLRSLQVLIFLLLCLGITSAQSPQPANFAPQPVITFTLDFPHSQPEHYSIRIPSTGTAQYQSNGRISADSDVADDFTFDFTLSPETQAKIFTLTRKADYFRKDLDSHRKNLAFTGKKTLRYEDVTRTEESTYNLSLNPAAAELTTLMQNLSATLEFGHRLSYDLRYQKLALNQELSRMQQMADSQMLVEVAAIRPILEQITADPSVMNIARARAQHLLDSVR